jgi:hypothetical protein
MLFVILDLTVFSHVEKIFARFLYLADYYLLSRYRLQYGDIGTSTVESITKVYW